MFSESNRASLKIARETQFNTEPSPFNATALRFTKSSLAVAKATAVSDEIRADRMIPDNIVTGYTSGGQVDFELSLGGTYDDLISGALCAEFSTPVAFTGSATVDSVAGSITATGAFTNAKVGQFLNISGFTNAGNNGWKKVKTVTSADAIVVDVTGLVNETATAAKINGKTLQNGVEKVSYAIEQGFTDINVFQLFLGQVIAQLSLDITAGSKITGNMQFMGCKGESATASFVTATTAATTTSVVNATSNIGTINSDSVALSTAIQSVKLTVNNNLRNQNAVASQYPAGIGLGRQQVSGDLTAYFQDKALYDKFLNHEYVDLSFDIEDSAGHGMHVYLPKINFSTAAPAPGGVDQDVMETLSFVAVYDPVSGCQIQVDIY